MNTIIKPKSRKAWLAEREQGIGSSEVGTILGLNPWETPYQLWRRKMGIDPPKQENFAMRAGHYLEDAVSLFYSDETGKDIIKSSEGDWLIVSNEKPFMRVSPDRTFWLPDMPHNRFNKGILECKTTQMQIDSEDLPKHWFCQLQYQLGVAELKVGALAWLTAGREFGYKDIAFDAEFFAWMAEEVEKFWRDHIIEKQEPAATEVSDILLKYPKHLQGQTLLADTQLLLAYEELVALKKEKGEAEKRIKELEDEFKMAMGECESVTTSDGKTLCTWKASAASLTFDAKALQKAEPDIYERYQIEKAGTRRFLLK